jgi:dCMP deaminase
MAVISWNEYFMEIAVLSSKRSKDPKTQVGACIVNPKTNHIVSIGYNGMPYGVEDSEYFWDDERKHNFVVHAEVNAILNSELADLSGMVLYVTEFPCNECAKLIAQKRFAKVIYKNPKFENKEFAKITKEILSLAGVELCPFKD